MPATKTRFPKRRCNLAYKILNEFLTKHLGMVGDAKVYSNQEWNDRGEQWQGFAVLTLDGSPLYEVFNYCVCQALLTEFDTMLKAHGFYYELGYAWSVHLYDA